MKYSPSEHFAKEINRQANDQGYDLEQAGGKPARRHIRNDVMLQPEGKASQSIFYDLREDVHST